MTTYAATTVATHFLDLAMQDNKQLTNMQLNKLVYFAHGWMLGLHGESLIKDTIQAWKYGPVIPSVYKKYKQYGNQPIKVSSTKARKIEEKPLSIIKQTFAIYGKMSALELSGLTHEYGSPWFLAVISSENEISNDSIDEYFRRHSSGR